MMTPDATRLLSADLDETGAILTARWGDGHAGAYPLRLLRAECPCASCKAERQDAADNPFHVLRAVPSADLVRVEPVGRYGMRLVWADGHATGIYTFAYLREICPCEVCRAARPADATPYVHGIFIPR
jgi:DUF971 family protein